MRERAWANGQCSMACEKQFLPPDDSFLYCSEAYVRPFLPPPSPTNTNLNERKETNKSTNTPQLPRVRRDRLPPPLPQQPPNGLPHALRPPRPPPHHPPRQPLAPVLHLPAASLPPAANLPRAARRHHRPALADRPAREPRRGMALWQRGRAVHRHVRWGVREGARVRLRGRACGEVRV